MRSFKFVAPDNGDQIVAEWTSAADFAIHKMTNGLCGKKAHNYHYILCITQWGMDRQTDIVVSRCKRCGLTKAYELLTFDKGVLESDVESVPDF
jgi:hypothetical protein